MWFKVMTSTENFLLKKYYSLLSAKSATYHVQKLS